MAAIGLRVGQEAVGVGNMPGWQKGNEWSGKNEVVWSAVRSMASNCGPMGVSTC